jgi:hypothetical protein
MKRFSIRSSFAYPKSKWCYANSQGMANTFKAEVMTGIHALGPGTGVPARTISTPDTVKAALFLASGSRGPGDATYSVTSEMSGTGYTAGGVTVTMANAPHLDTTTGCFTPSASFQWTGFTSAGAFDCCMMYNSSQGNKNIAVFTFGSQNITSGTFTLTMPSDVAATALLRIA